LAIEPDAGYLAADYEKKQQLLRGALTRAGQTEDDCSIRTLGQHKDSVNCVATLRARLDFPRKKDLVVSGSSDATLMIWDPLATNDLDICVAILTGHTGPITSVLVIKDAGGKDLIASGSTDGTIRLWDLEAGTELVHYRIFSLQPVIAGNSHMRVHSLALLQPRNAIDSSPWNPKILLYSPHKETGKVKIQGNTIKVRSAVLVVLV
jgi:WD40 repeat protein